MGQAPVSTPAPPVGTTTWTIWPLVGATGNVAPSQCAAVDVQAPPASTTDPHARASRPVRTATTRSPWRSTPTASASTIRTPRWVTAARSAALRRRPSRRAAWGL